MVTCWHGSKVCSKALRMLEGEGLADTGPWPWLSRKTELTSDSYAMPPSVPCLFRLTLASKIPAQRHSNKYRRQYQEFELYSDRVRSRLTLTCQRPGARTADEYSNLVGQDRPHATNAGSRAAPTTRIDLSATHSHRGGRRFDRSIAHPAQRPAPTMEQASSPRRSRRASGASRRSHRLTTARRYAPKAYPR